MDPSASRQCSKLKFHHSDLSGPSKNTHRSSDYTVECQEDGDDAVDVEDYCSSLRFSRFKTSPGFVHRSLSSFCSEDGGESLLSKRIKCRRQDRVRGMSIAEEVDDDDDSRAFDNLLQHSKWNKDLSSKGGYQTTCCQGLVSPSKWAKEWLVGHDDDDDDDDDIDVDVDGALNLCMADRSRKSNPSPSKGCGQRKRESHATEHGLRSADGPSFQDFVRQRTFGFSRFRNEDVPMNVKFKFDQCGVLDDEARVLDLSTKRRPDKTPRFSSEMRKDGSEDVPSSSPALQCYRTSEGELHTNRFPPISELLENMRLQDDDIRQNTLNRYHAAREKLMETHSDMFGGWAMDRAELLQRSKPIPDNKSSTFHDDSYGDKVHHHRPRSWDTTSGPIKSMGITTLPGMADSRPESAEPCLESVPLYTQNQFDVAPGLFPLQAVSCASIPMLSVPDERLLTDDQCDEQRCWSLDSNSSHPCSKVIHGTEQSDSRGSILKQPDSKMRAESLNVSRVKTTSRKSTSSSPSSLSSETMFGQYPNDISICKFKLIKGVHPVLEKKKSFFVPMPRGSAPRADDIPHELSSEVPVHANELQTAAFSTPSSSPPSVVSGTTSLPDRFRMYKIHIGSQEDVGKKLVAGKRLRRRSRKALVREKLEATFREQGFLIKTQQVSSAEGAVYCKFRQLKKFTRYLYKSWKDHLPKELDEIAKTSSCSTSDTLTS